jgi:pimeloyl-ACP methyl ester carboxylesterase
MDAATKRVTQLDVAGAGAAVVLLQADAAPSRIAPLLAEQFRVLRFAVAASDAARTGPARNELAEVLASQGGDPIGIVADPATADVALAVTAARPELVRALALIAPPLPKSALADLKTPVLALFGTRAMPPQIGRHMRAAIPNCHVMLVYDADGDMANQRPEAVAAALREFMLLGDRFLVTGKSGKLYP